MQLRERERRCASKGVMLVLLLYLAGIMSVGVAHAQQYNPCPYLNDGDCDEPEGLGYCAEGTDVADCSNPNSNYGTGSGYPGGSGSGAGVGASTERYTYAAWGSNDFQSQFSRPGGVSPLSIIYDPSVRNGAGFYAGVYDIYLADAGAYGNGPYTEVDRYTVTLQPNTVYTVDMNQIYTNPSSLTMNRNWGLTIHYGEPGEGRATIFVNNSNTSDWRAICVLPTGAPFTVCEAAMGLPQIIDLLEETPVP